MQGSITINGFERNLSQFRKLSCYIMQDNQLHGNLTVEEAMKVATSLKLSSNLSRRHKEEVVSFYFIIYFQRLSGKPLPDVNTSTQLHYCHVCVHDCVW